MGRDLQKRKRRSSRPATRQPSSNRPKRLLNPLGNDLIAKNWNKNETTSQNYKRLGLVSRLRTPTGGVEPELKSQVSGDKPSTKPKDPFSIQPTGVESVFSEARVERDENGKIVRVIHSGKKAKPNPLNDPLNGLDSDSEEEDDEEMADDGETWGGIEEDNTTDIVKALEAEANIPRVKKVRGLSERETEWLESLIAKHGDNTKKMARDRKLNPMQQTEADIARRIRKLTGEKS